MPRLTKIYTRKGDKGKTAVIDHTLPKDHPLLETLGTLDELNALLGLILSYSFNEDNIRSCLKQIQNDLFDLGAELVMPQQMRMTKKKVNYLEQQLDSYNANLPILQEFILPGGNTLAAHAHLARTVCRRAERRLVSFRKRRPFTNPHPLAYLNRLSDLLFVLARVFNQKTGAPEPQWQHK